MKALEVVQTNISVKLLVQKEFQLNPAQCLSQADMIILYRNNASERFVFSNTSLSLMAAVALGSICWPDVVMWSWFQWCAFETKWS